MNENFTLVIIPVLSLYGGQYLNHQKSIAFGKFGSLPNDKTMIRPKLKAFAGSLLSISHMVRFVFDWIENIVRKGENAGRDHLRFFP